jgi:holliday junction DNA helicase RuvA
MIARLRGILAEKSKERVIVDVNGVGYGMLVPETVLLHLPVVGAEVIFEVYTHVREDALLLFGFSDTLERETFEILLSANGVGPKLAITILSVLTARQVLEAIVRGDKGELVAIPGIGKKTAERIVLEIKEKCEKRLFLERAGGDKSKVNAGLRKSVLSDLGSAKGGSIPWAHDLEEALRALGYRDQDLKPVLSTIYERAEELGSFEGALKFALQQMTSLGGSHALRGNA